MGGKWVCEGKGFDYHCHRTPGKRSVPDSSHRETDVVMHVFACMAMIGLLVGIHRVYVAWSRRRERANMTLDGFGRGREGWKAEV